MLAQLALDSKSKATIYQSCYDCFFEIKSYSTMTLTEDKSSAKYQIRAYQPGAITINEQTYSNSVIISTSHLITDWPPQSLAELQPEHLATILALQPEIVILGAGKRFILPPPAQLAPLYQAGFGVECMDTGAACRTFMVLATEGRHVVAALLID